MSMQIEQSDFVSCWVEKSLFVIRHFALKPHSVGYSIPNFATIPKFYVGEKGPYALAYRIDKDYSRWFVDAVMNCSRKGGGCWTITVNKLRRDSSGKHWYIVADK